MTHLTTIKLYGFLAKKYGKVHKFALDWNGQAILALKSQLPGFEQDLISHQPGYHVVYGGRPLDGGKDLHNTWQSRGGQEIKIIPAVAGAGDGKAVIQVIVGALLIIYAPYLAPYVEAIGLTAASIGSIGVSLVLGGITQMLAQRPKADGPRERPESAPSYMFNGPVNTIASGHPVPIGYGRMRVGSNVVSMGIFFGTVTGAVTVQNPALGANLIRDYSTAFTTGIASIGGAFQPRVLAGTGPVLP